MSDTLLKRDAMGTHPLYYYEKDPSLCADSVCALLDKGVPKKLSVKGLKSYLVYGAVQEPLTLIEGVMCAPLPSYENLTKGSIPFAGTRDDLQLVVSDAFAQAVREDLSGIEEPAAFLSGGIDSSAVVAMMRKVHPGKIKTYCVTHEDLRTDERQWARRVAEHLGTEHHELLLTSQMIKEDIPEALNAYDQPSLDGINMWFGCKLVREAGATSVFSGTGGDELFMGYGQFAKHRLAYKYGRLFKFIPQVVGQLIAKCAPNEKVRKLGLLMGIKGDPYYLPRRIFDDTIIRGLVKEEYWTDEPFPMLGWDAPQGDLLNRISWMECRTSLLSMYLKDGYQVSQAHGVDVKLPLLNEELVKLMISAPSALKVDAQISKPLLVNAVTDGIPMDCVTRKKMGFTLPFDAYFREALREPLLAFFERGESQLFNAKALKTVWQMYLTKRINWTRIWALYVVEMWWKRISKA